MKKTLLITGALLALAVPAFAAGECNIAWNECILDATAAQNKTNACTTTTGSSNFVASFIPPVDCPHYVGMNAVVDLQTSGVGPSLSPWFSFDLPASSSCHGGKLASSADFTAATGACIDFFGGGASGGGNFTQPSPTVAPPSARLKQIWSVPETAAGDISPTSPTGGPNQYYAFKCTILNSMNTGFTLANCPGCSDHACIVLNQLNIGQLAPTPDIPLTTGTQTFITWQGGTGTQLCPGATPTHKSTWGSVKALYR